MTSIFGRLGVDLTAPDHTTLSRRGQHLALALRRARPGTRLHLIVASTGLSIVGDGAWAAATHGGRGRRGWRKLPLGVDGSRVIGACALTEPTADDAIPGISLVDEVDGHLTRVTADPASDTLAFSGAAGARGARGVVPPTKTASLSRRGARSGARDRTIRRVKALGRRRWKKASGDHQHARVENAFFRYTSIVGDCLRARSSSGQRREAVLACHVLSFVREPEGNGVAERFIRTLKENQLWVRSFATIEALRLALLAFKRTYNEQWMLEKYDYRSPAQVRRDLVGLDAAA